MTAAALLDHAARRPRADGYVCVFNRNRDSYQVPLALAEAGLLQRFVTDFYAPRGGVARLLPGFLRGRRVDGLPRALTRSVWRSFAAQSALRALRLEGGRGFEATDAMLARAAAREARRSGAALYCYHSYIPRALPADAALVVFAYHPRARAERALLEPDARLYPEVAAAFARERGAAASEPAIDWARIDAVVCASSFTRASLLAEGCAAEKIAVIPYGSPFAPSQDGRRDAAASAEFLFVGQGVQRKGLHHLIRAWQEAPPERARLTIVSYRIDPAIAALVRDRSIRVLGYQPRSALSALFAASDVFVMPSLVEGFGLVYCEALAHGCHVIGTPNTGLPDLALGADAATLVAAGDLAALSRSLRDAARIALGGGFDRAAIAAAGARWTQADFRHAIAAHAARVLM